MILLALALQVSGDALISGGGIEIRTTSRLAGAIDSLRWNGKEFIDSADHGRQLQSASNLDAGAPITDETFNPTEAGSRADGAGPRSSSALLFLRAEGAELETRSKMAFWLQPGERSGPNLAKNATLLSEHGLWKKVKIDGRVLDYAVTFTLPAGETHRQATFEALTGYMPADFSRFLAFDPATGEARPLSDGPGEQALPVILSTPSGSHAMGVYAKAVDGMQGPGFGRFRFGREKVVKWNAVYRLRRPDGIPAGDYAFRLRVPVGALEDVVAELRRLHGAR